MDSQIEIKRETEFYQGFIRLKMSVSNKAPSVITDVTLDFLYEDDLLRIDRYEPPYEVRNGKVLLGNISGGTSKSIAVYFDPLMCTKSAEINCHVTYRDALGNVGFVPMERKFISVVCPIIKTDLDINVGRLKEFIEKLPSKDSKIYEIQQGFGISKLASIAREVVEKHDVRHVRILKTKDGRDWEIWYYGKTKVTRADIVIKISISSEKHLIELFAATETAESLTGLLADFGRDLKQSIESLASGKGNVINVTIRDSVIQRSNLLDLCSMDGTCPVNILVEDSIIQLTTLISEREEAKEEQRLRKEREEQERLRRQQEEETRLRKAEEERLRREKEEEETRKRKESEEKERLRKQQEEAARNIEEIKRKAQEEADRRKKDQEKKQQEELRKQREEAERNQREEAERKGKEKEAQERKQKEEQERKRREEEEKARREREEQERLRKQKEETERKAREELERKKLEEASKTQTPKQTVQSPAQKKISPQKPESSSGKGILVFSLIFGIFLIGAVAMLLDSNGDSDNDSQEIQPVSLTPSEDIEEDIPEATASSAQSSSSQNSDTYTNSIGMEFVEIPAGEFMMGSPSDEEDRDDDEGPVHKVTIEEAFYLGKFEVTQEHWREVMGSDPSWFEGDDLPVEKVSWEDAQEFIETLNEMEGTNKYRLPSEAEWEYACRAGTTTRYSFGDDESKLRDYAWYDENSGRTTHPVGQKKPNPWGLYDMYGNVWEWCQDRYHSDYEGAPSDGSAWEDGSSPFRVARGGGWGGNALVGSARCGSALDYRSAYRYDYGAPGRRASLIGFRVLRTP